MHVRITKNIMNKGSKNLSEMLHLDTTQDNHKYYSFIKTLN